MVLCPKKYVRNLVAGNLHGVRPISVKPTVVEYDVRNLVAENLQRVSPLRAESEVVDCDVRTVVS